MAAGEGDSDWGGDAAADTTTTEELLPAGRSSNLDHSGQQHVRLQEEELHHFLLNKEEAAAAAETHVSLKESEAAAGAPGASPDEPTISVSKFPLPVNLHLNLSFANTFKSFWFISHEACRRFHLSLFRFVHFASFLMSTGENAKIYKI